MQTVHTICGLLSPLLNSPSSCQNSANLCPPHETCLLFFPHTAATPRQCEVCCTAASKYCCPRCSRRTCSLLCSNQHKSVDACSGTRDRTAFVTMQNFDDRTLMSGENQHMQNHMHRCFNQLISDDCQLSPVAASATFCCAALSHVLKPLSGSSLWLNDALFLCTISTPMQH